MANEKALNVTKVLVEMADNGDYDCIIDLCNRYLEDTKYCGKRTHYAVEFRKFIEELSEWLVENPKEAFGYSKLREIVE